MANPKFVRLPKNTWACVAASVTSGQVFKADLKPASYISTYRMAGGEKPTAFEEGVEVFLTTNYEVISAPEAIDVYMMAVGNKGQVRVDL